MNNNVPGWMSTRDLEILSYLASCVPENGNILEIGPFLGRSTSALINTKKDSVTLDVVDTFTGISVDDDQHDIVGDKVYFEELRALAKETGNWEASFKVCQNNNLKKMNVFKCSSQSFKIEKSYNLTFIDADHTYAGVSADIKKFIHMNGIIAGDDFIPKWPDVAKAVNFFQSTNYATLVVPRGSKIWILVPINKYWEKCIKEII